MSLRRQRPDRSRSLLLREQLMKFRGKEELAGIWELKAVRVAGAAVGAAVKAPSSAGGAGPGAAAAVPGLGEVQGFSVHRIGVAAWEGWASGPSAPWGKPTRG